MNRRTFLTAMTAIALVPMSSFAASPAESLVDRVVSDINKVIASGKSLNGMIRDFENIFNRYADVEWIAGSSLGPAARGMPARQRKAYVSAFTGYISRKYGKRFNEFVGGRIEIEGTQQVKNYYEVQTVAFLQGESPFALEFLVNNRTGKNLFFDMVIEGISLRLSEKAEIGAMLDKRRGNIDLLIEDLKKAG